MAYKNNYSKHTGRRRVGKSWQMAFLSLHLMAWGGLQSAQAAGETVARGAKWSATAPPRPAVAPPPAWPAGMRTGDSAESLSAQGAPAGAGMRQGGCPRQEDRWRR